MTYHIITIFPEVVNSYLSESILGRAIKNKKISVKFYNPRDFVRGKYRKVWPDGNVSAQVDERPYGGGPGMVMMAEPVLRAAEAALKKIRSTKFESQNKLKIKNKKLKIPPKGKVIIFSPSGKKFTTEYAKRAASKYTDIIMICGRYEGVDARVKKVLKDQKIIVEDISVGDYVLTGGEIPAMILIDSISRQIEGVLGNFDSREEERVSSSEVYSRPEVLIYPPSPKASSREYKVPKVLLSGDHKKIEEWKQGKKKVVAKEYTLKELLKGMTKKNLHKNVFPDDKPRGKEIW